MKNEKKSEGSSKAPPAAGGRQKHVLICCALLLGAILALLFHQDFNSAYVPFSNDGPYGAMVAEQNRMPSIMHGLWVNLNWLGNEGLAPAPSVTSAMRLVTSPLVYAKILCPASLFIAGLCACFCFRQLRLARGACVLGGVAVALNSEFFSTSCWGVSSQIVGFGAMYVAVGLVGRSGQKHLWIRTVLAGLAVGVGVIEAYDIGALFSIVVAAYVVYHALFLRAGESAAQKISVGFLQTGLVAFFAAFIAVRALTGLVGTQISGVVGAAQDEQTKIAQWTGATMWSLPKIETLQVLIPGVFGFRDDWYMFENDRPIEDQYWGNIGNQPGLQRMSGTGLYAGVLVVLVALWTILQSFRGKDSPFTKFQRRSIWFWAAVLPVTLLFAFGKFAPFYQLFYALPYASTIRSPTKFMHVFSWALTIIFAYGLHGLSVAYLDNATASVGGMWARFKEWLAKAATFERGWFYGSLGAIGFSLLGWLIYSGKIPTLTAYLQTVGIAATEAPDVARFSVHAVGWFVLFLALSVLVLGLIFSGQFSGARAKWGWIMLGALLLFDLGRADAPWISYWNIDYKYAVDPVIKLLADKPYEHRVTMFPIQPSNEQLALLQNAYSIDWKQHIFLASNIQSADVIQEPRLAVDKEEFMIALHVQQPRSLMDMLRFWELSNTKYILAPGGNFIKQLDPTGTHFRVVQNFNFVPKRGNPGPWPEDFAAEPDPNGQLAVIEYVDALPRAKLYSTWQAKVKDDVALQTLAAPDFDPHQMVLVSDDVPAPASPNQDAGTVEINPNYKSKRIELTADVKAPSVLMLSERYNPQWQVDVDGQPAPLLRCDFILRGVYLQPGKHDVVFHYSAPAKTLYVSLAAVLLGLGLAGFLIFDKSAADDEEEEEKDIAGDAAVTPPASPSQSGSNPKNK